MRRVPGNENGKRTAPAPFAPGGNQLPGGKRNCFDRKADAQLSDKRDRMARIERLA